MQELLSLHVRLTLGCDLWIHGLTQCALHGVTMDLHNKMTRLSVDSHCQEEILCVAMTKVGSVVVPLAR